MITIFLIPLLMGKNNFIFEVIFIDFIFFVVFSPVVRVLYVLLTCVPEFFVPVH